MAFPESWRGFLAALGLVGFLLGQFAFWTTWIGWRRRRRQASWLPVQGTVRAAEVREVFQLEGDNDFTCDVFLRYNWRGETFDGAVAVEGGERFSKRAGAEEFARGFAAGQVHTVFVNPESPGQVVMRSARESGLGKELAVYGIVTLVSGLLCYQGWDRVRW